MTSCFHYCSFGNDTSGHQTFNNTYHHRQDELPSDDKKNQEIDALLSQAFNRLTFEERQEQQHLLHGVDDEIEEDFAFVNSSLQELDEHLMRIKTGTVYEKAEMMDSVYVSARAFRVMFLRGNRYDPKAAADQMIRFFKMKQKLFGTERLVKDITIDDMDEDDRDCVRCGSMQVAGYSRSNRLILLQLPGLREFKQLANELRARYFIFMKVLEDEEAQRRGIISLNYSIGHYKDSKNGEGFLDHFHLSMALPLYPAAFHVCTDDWPQRALGNVCVSIMPAKERARIRLHYGTHMECLYVLSTYGVPGSVLPFVPETNTIDLEPHLKWYKRCFARGGPKKNLLTPELPSSGEPIIADPNPNDVLSSGSTTIDNLGNNRLRMLVLDSVEGYHNGSYEEKRLIVERIIGEIHEAGGRFLNQDKGSKVWKEVSVSKVRLKICQRIRNHMRQRETASHSEQEGMFVAGTALPVDVIFGRAQKSKGNDLLHLLIKERSEDYEALDRKKKVVVVDSIIERIKTEGGRFLQQRMNHEGYVELSTDSTRERISTYFRNHRRLRKKKNSSLGK